MPPKGRKKQTNGTVSEGSKMLDLAEKSYRTITKMFKVLKGPYSKN